MGFVYLNYASRRVLSVAANTTPGGPIMKHAKYLTAFLIIVLLSTHVVYGRVPTALTPSYDGYTTAGAKTDNANFIQGGSGTARRGFIEFNTSDIPDAAVIDNVTLRYRTYSSNVDGGALVYQMELRPTNNSAADVFADADNGTLYHTTPVTQSTDTWYQVDLGANAYTDLENNLPHDWFAVGVDHNGTNTNTWYSSETAYDPVLTVKYHLATDTTYQFTGVYYENGTATGDTYEITATDSFTEAFNLNNNQTTEYYPVEPSHFYWDLGSFTRYLFSDGGENFTITVPESTAYSYGFTVKDYTGKLGAGDAYLEAYRVINGTETLIERQRITQPNPTGLTLVYGKTYHIQILFSDGTRYDWGYFLAGGDFTNTILIRETTFSDQLHSIYGVIQVEATRSADGATITVNYNDTREQTTWANVTITQRGAGAVLNAARSNDTYTINYGCNASLGYIVSIEGLHGDFGEWGYVWILDQTETFPDAPTLDGIWDFGLGANLGGWVIVMSAVLGFSKLFKARALIVGVVVATLLNYVGFSTWSTDLLIFGWFFSVAVALATGGGE